MDQDPARSHGTVCRILHLGLREQAQDQAGAGAVPVREPDEHPAHLHVPAQAADGRSATQLRAAQQGAHTRFLCCLPSIYLFLLCISQNRPPHHGRFDVNLLETPKALSKAPAQTADGGSTTQLEAAQEAAQDVLGCVSPFLSLEFSASFPGRPHDGKRVQCFSRERSRAGSVISIDGVISANTADVTSPQVLIDLMKDRVSGPGPNTDSPANLAFDTGFKGELNVTLCEAENLPVWGLGFLSDPHCILTIGQQEVRSKRDSDTSIRGKAGNPVWNQDFFFLIEDPFTQKLVVQVRFSLFPTSFFRSEISRPVWDRVSCEEEVGLFESFVWRVWRCLRESGVAS